MGHVRAMQDRLIPLERVLNFRDFGGYDTADGARLKRGVLYRSAAFHDASDADVAALDRLGVGLVVDLRRPEERAFEPNRWPGQNARVITNDEGGAQGLPPHLVALLQSDLTPQSVADYMRNAYREFPFDPRHIALYRAWFEGLGEGAPSVIHCAAGKDRTGLGCALTLIALGVLEEAVYADYEFTNQAVDIEARLPRIQARMEERLSRKLDPVALRPMLGVNVDYLRTAFDAIEARHGSVEAYLEQVLGVNVTTRTALRETLAQ